MSHRTLVLGVEAALPTTTGTATSVTEASVVRLINNDSSAHLVTVVETQSGSTVGSFTMPGGSVEFLEKQYAYCVWSASANVRGTKVGFTQ